MVMGNIEQIPAMKFAPAYLIGSLAKNFAPAYRVGS